MRWIGIATIAAATALSSAPAMADCAGDWEDRGVKASGVVRAIGSDEWGWWIEVRLKTNDGCDIEEIFDYGGRPANCRVGGRFDVTGHFEYDEESDYHFELYMEDILTIHADSISCR